LCEQLQQPEMQRKSITITRIPSFTTQRSDVLIFLLDLLAFSNDDLPRSTSSVSCEERRSASPKLNGRLWLLSIGRAIAKQRYVVSAIAAVFVCLPFTTND